MLLQCIEVPVFIRQLGRSMLDGVHESAENTARVFSGKKYQRANVELCLHVLKGVSNDEEKEYSRKCEEVWPCGTSNTKRSA
jgi:hypothetical protein